MIQHPIRGPRSPHRPVRESRRPAAEDGGRKILVALTLLVMLDPQDPHIAAGATGRRGRHGRDRWCAEGCRESTQTAASCCGHSCRPHCWPRGRGRCRATTTCEGTRAGADSECQRGRPADGRSSTGRDQPAAAAEGERGGGYRRGHSNACAASSESGSQSCRASAYASTNCCGHNRSPGPRTASGGKGTSSSWCRQTESGRKGRHLRWAQARRCPSGDATTSCGGGTQPGLDGCRHG